MARGLNARQRDFVDAVTGGPDGVRGNVTQAAAAAGYKQPRMHGPRLMKNDAVAAVIAARQAEAAAAAKLTLEGFVQECRDQANWYKTHDERPNSSSVKALELVGKALGFLDPRERENIDPVTGVELLSRRPVALMEKIPIARDV